MGNHKALMLQKWPRESLRDDRVAVFAERFPTIERLHEFHEDTRNLAWPESFGQSPWEFSGMVAHLVFACEAKVPDHFDEPWRSDLVRAIEGLEDRHILAGDRARIFRDRLFRVVARGLQDQPTRHATFTMTSPFYFRDAHFVAALQADDNPLQGNIVIYRGQEFLTERLPIAVFPVREIIRTPSADINLMELARIFRFASGHDGYQWGDTRGDEGGFNAETLACLALLGYARRTGNDVPNGLGGTWPEIEVTPAGVLALMKSDVMNELQKTMTAAKATVPIATIASGAWGNFDFCVRTGAVLGLDPLGVHHESRAEDMPVRIDVSELATAYPDEEIAGQTYDILDVGYWMADGRYESPEEDFREELRHCRAAP